MEKEYKRKGIRADILWEKTYYNNDMFQLEKKWQNLVMLYRFMILKNLRNNKTTFIIDPLLENVEGKTRKEMVGNLQDLLKGMKEWKLKGKHWKEADFFPTEVNKQLLKFNLQNYVKKIP